MNSFQTPAPSTNLLTRDLDSLGWARVGVYTVITMLIWTACWFVTRFVAHRLGATWVDATMPGAGLALATGLAWEYVRRDRFRRRAAR